MNGIINTNVVTDFDTAFVIDSITREITNPKLTKKVLIQNDHNSERFTFEVPRYIEGRDIALCNVVEIYYVNIEGRTKKRATGVYTVDDMRAYPFECDVMTFSWLISQNATAHEGNLSFMVRFAQVTDDAKVKYSWQTTVYSDISVLESLESADIYEREYVDIIQQWKNSVMEELSTYVEVAVKENVNVAQIDVNKQDISELSSEQATLKSRMDAFTALGEGSTTGDAELQDIRVGVDGKKYSNAGEAVRGQIDQLNDKLTYGTIAINNEPVYEFKTGSHVELTLPGIVEVFANGSLYRVEDLTTRFDFAPNTYSLFNIIFNCLASSISVQYFQTPIPKGGVIIGQSFAFDLRLNISCANMWSINTVDGYNPIDLSVWTYDLATMTYTDGHISLYLPECYVNTGYVAYDIAERTIEYDSIGHGIYNILYNRVNDDLRIEYRATRIPSGYQRIGLIHTTYGVYLNGGTFSTNINNVGVAPLILGNGYKYVEFDSVKKTVTFPNDTLIQNNRAFLWQKIYYQLSTAKGNNILDYSHMSSSALVIYYDTLTDSLGVTQYNQHVSCTKIPIASFRTGCGQVSINAPYKWDGRPFNMDASDFGINTTVYDISDFKTEFLVKSVNHRGYCTEAPENTLSAYKLSAKNGFSYAECDVSFTSDNVPVLLHDATIDRTSNGSGNINDLTLSEVRSYDFGSWFDAKYAGEKIPTFEEFIALCRKLSIHPYIEIKSSATYTQEQINMLVDIIKRYGMVGNVSYISFNASYLNYVQNYDPEARLGYVVDSVSENVITKAIELKTETNEVFINAAVSNVTTDTVELCMSADLPLEVWTCNSADYINTTLDPYVSGVTSDSIHAGKSLFEKNL